MKPLIIAAALTGAGNGQKQAPAVPVSAEEIAQDVVAAAKAGAAIAHIHVRDEDGYGTMKTSIFESVVSAVRAELDKEHLDIILNLTTSGGKSSDDERIEHLRRLQPEMCSFDAGTMNWANTFVFENSPQFLEKLGMETQLLKIKPEIEIFDGSMMGNAMYYIKKGILKMPCHFQFVLGVPGGLDATVRNLQFLYEMLPPGATWSVTGIGKGHMPMLLGGLALGADCIRVGLEDNVYYSKGEFATNAQLVERAVRIAAEAGRYAVMADEARDLLGIARKKRK